MASKVKVNKKRKGMRDAWRELSLQWRILVCTPVVLALVLAVVLVVLLTHNVSANQQHANRELLLSTDGHWETMEKYGIDVWCPNDLTKEDVTGEYADSKLLFATRDKGKFPERSFGVIVVPDELANGRTFDLENDTTTILDVVTPLVTNAFGEMINGAYPTMSIDIESMDTAAGKPAIIGSGEATVTLVFQDPKDPENPYAEETTTNIYYSVVVFHNRPVIVWGTWDYSIYMGEDLTIAAVTDAVLSLLPSGSENVVEPLKDDWTDTKPVINIGESGQDTALGDEEGESNYSTDSSSDGVAVDDSSDENTEGE